MNIDKACKKAAGSQELAIGAHGLPFDVLSDCHGSLGIRFTNIQPQNSESSQTMKKSKTFVQDGSSVSIQCHLLLVESSLLCQFALSQQFEI